MSTFDLSLLPEPDSISNVSYDANLQLLIDRFKLILPEFTAYLASDPVVKIFEACAYVLTLKDEQRNDQIRAVLVSFALGNDLDNLGALLAESRQVEEDDERYRLRILTALHKASSAGVAQAYEALALESDSRVKDVKSYDDESQPAKAFVSVMSNVSSDGAADTDLINTVQDYLNDEDRKPLGVQVLVNSIDVIDYTVDAVVEFREDADKEVVNQRMLDAITKLVGSKHKIGAEIALSEIYASLNIEGVAVVQELNQPTANIKAGKHQAPFCTHINIIESV